jgi:hypothetical protein
MIDLDLYYVILSITSIMFPLFMPLLSKIRFQMGDIFSV